VIRNPRAVGRQENTRQDLARAEAFEDLARAEDLAVPEEKRATEQARTSIIIIHPTVVESILSKYTTMTAKPPASLSYLNLEIGIIQGRKLVPKDRTLAGLGRAHTSDPYIEIWLGDHHYGTTRTVKRSLDPYWNETFHISITQPQQVNTFFENGNNVVQLRIFDKDEYSQPDKMGVVNLTIEPDCPTSCLWYRVEKGEGKLHCHNARGELRIQVSVTAAKLRSMHRGNVYALDQWSSVRVGLGWEMEQGNAIDLDASCVAVDRTGQISMAETVYYGNLSTTAIQHSGDEQEGDESIGDAGFDEIITVNFAKIPANILALYVVLTVATPNKTLNEIQSAFVRVFQTNSQQTPICQFTPAKETIMATQQATALFLVRISRNETNGWSVSPIGDTDPAARDFGVLVPRIKAYTRDLIPNLQINPKERIAILKKNQNIRLSDFSSATAVSMGLGWDVTDGVNIDLDASAVCLDKDLNFVEAVWYRKLQSENCSIIHSGDNRTGAGSGDDETINVELKNIPANVKYVGFVINSFSGQELDDVKQARCHLYKRDSPGVDIATYTLSNTVELDKHTALVLACMYRADDGEWYLRIISEAAQGRTVEDNVDELQNFLRRSPPPPAVPVPEEPDIDLSVMPDVVPMEEEEIAIAPSS